MLCNLVTGVAHTLILAAAMDDLIAEFIVETNENLGSLDVDLVKLELAPEDSDLLGRVFRVFHTIKGTCGFLGLGRLEGVAHSAENILGQIRDGQIAADSVRISIILQAVDRIKVLLVELGRDGVEPEGEDRDLIAALDAAALSVAGDVPPTSPAFPFDEMPAVQEEASLPMGDLPMANVPEAALSQRPVMPKKPVEPDGGAVAPAAAIDSQATIRVGLGVLENMMTLVSELVLTRNQIQQVQRSHARPEFAGPFQRLNQVVSELQEQVMKTRMQPIGNAWAKLPRIVRDLGHELGKKIDLVMLGAETELDRQVLELIRDPLTHMVRNSADHGIEPPTERLAAGKPETGRIRLSAFHEGGQVIIEISDDGRGMPMARIRRKLVERNWATEAEAAAMSDAQVRQYIFKPGFSTAETVTSVSGRGVGMDVVRANIERIGGTVEFSSIEGRGTRFMIRIPLTLAIISALIFEAEGERFALSQASIVELVLLDGAAERRVEYLKGNAFLRLRNRLLPLVSLRHVLNPTASEDAELEGFVIVVNVGNTKYGLVVDQVFDTEEIVVKPVSPLLRQETVYSGNTILGDGRVVMILDPSGLAASLTGEPALSVVEDLNQEEVTDTDVMEKTAFLVFKAGGFEVKGVPLGLVARIEDVALSDIEQSSDQMVIQYRGTLMPLVPFDPAFDPEGSGTRPVLVFAEDGRQMGLIVDDIVDIVSTELELKLVSERPGLIGSMTLQGHATDIIDVGYYVEQAFHNWFERDRRLADELNGESRRLLFVDDSAFFRSMMTPRLAARGYRVHVVGSAADALARLESSTRPFFAIVTDIDMPDMDGIEFAKRVRANPRFAKTPLIALSSLAKPASIAAGLAAGIDNYVSKAERDAVFDHLARFLENLAET